VSIYVLREVWRHTRAKGSAWQVITALADSASKDEGITWRSQASIMEFTRIDSDRTVRDALRWLEENVEIETRVAQRGRSRINVYHVLLGDYGLVDVHDLAGFDVPFTVTEPFSPPADIAARRLQLVAIAMDAGPTAATQGRPADIAGGKPCGEPGDDRQSTTATTGSSCADDRQIFPSLYKEGPEEEPSDGPAAARATRGAAAKTLIEERLEQQGIELAGRDLVLVRNHPKLAEQWLDITVAEAHTNPAGFFLAGIRQRRSPSPRITRAQVRAASREATVRALLRNLGPEDGGGEARHYIDEVWTELTTSERSELHELVDELVSNQLPDQPAALTELAS
jgi:hypothetical protein